MSADIIVIIILCVMGFAAHGARKHPWMEWTLRVVYSFAFVAELWTAFVIFPNKTDVDASPWSTAVTATMAVFTGLMLFQPFRQGLSYALSVANNLINGQVLYALIKKLPVKEAFLVDRVFVPSSIPHLNGLWIYVTVLGSLLANINMDNFAAPSIGIPFPVPMDSLFSYNFLGLIILSAAGCGIFVARKPREVMVRLGLVKPEGWHYGVALLMIPLTFGYDWLWSYFTGSTGVGGKLSTYNAGTFTTGAAAANPASAAFLALATGVCAGVGEEVLMRGALQPVFGIIPAGILHGVLHGQFQHAPILILQVAGWSCIMGIVRKYTNTTTTIMAHATFNFLTTFLFAFNP